jgi:D-alanyl-D-alanine dipeptidase
MRLKQCVLPAVLLACAFLLLGHAKARDGKLPDGLVYLQNVIPDIKVELRYYSEDNFVGERIDGYLQPRCILTAKAAEALKGVQDELEVFGLGLKVYDGYRPQRAVDHFERWARDVEDIRMKKRYYPDADKRNLFADGYIASKSGHSRGSTVDLTIIQLRPGAPEEELDMGTGFDFFGPESSPDHPSTSSSGRAHRMLLRTLMTKHGFKPYSKEWWHFTLKDEPFPETYFDFPVQ